MLATVTSTVGSSASSVSSLMTRSAISWVICDAFVVNSRLAAWPAPNLSTFSSNPWMSRSAASVSASTLILTSSPSSLSTFLPTWSRTLEASSLAVTLIDSSSGPSADHPSELSRWRHAGRRRPPCRHPWSTSSWRPSPTRSPCDGARTGYAGTRPPWRSPCGDGCRPATRSSRHRHRPPQPTRSRDGLRHGPTCPAPSRTCRHHRRRARPRRTSAATSAP